MADLPSKTPPTMTPKAEAELQARRDREAAALRENLRRRKAQTREKAARSKAMPADPDAR
jgi:hypothetical protein